MKSVFRIAYQAYKWLVFIPFVGLCTLLCGGLCLVLLVLAGPRAANRFGATLWARLNGWMTPIFVVCEGMDHIHPQQSYVVVSNHQSQYDILLLYGWLGIDFKWVMKRELRSVPVIGYVCDKLGHIFIDRSDHAAALASLRAARSRIVEGTSVLFFPEGTRSQDGKLGVFKKGAFRMALQLSLPILPISIQGTREILPPRTLDLFPGTVRMRVHPPIDTAGYDDRNLKELMEITRKRIGIGMAASARQNRKPNGTDG